MSAIKNDIEAYEKNLSEQKHKINNILHNLPNIHLDDVPVGEDSKSNKEVKKFGSIKNFNFKNGQSLIICGFEENDLILEFNVIDCSSEKSISEYSAVQTCTYEFKNDTLKIFELKLLPSGKNWKWQFEKISVEIFTLKNNKIIKIPPKPIFYVDIQMSDFEQNEFINDIILNKDNGMQYDWEWEEIIGKLELLSLIKNEKALEILLNLEKITNYQLDGAFKEQYNDAISNINWILNN
mgnify:CR=1 FL=1